MRTLCCHGMRRITVAGELVPQNAHLCHHNQPTRNKVRGVMVSFERVANRAVLSQQEEFATANSYLRWGWKARYLAHKFPLQTTFAGVHMARVTVEDCIDKVENRFDLVLLASHRAR